MWRKKKGAAFSLPRYLQNHVPSVRVADCPWLSPAFHVHPHSFNIFKNCYWASVMTGDEDMTVSTSDTAPIFSTALKKLRDDNFQRDNKLRLKFVQDWCMEIMRGYYGDSSNFWKGSVFKVLFTRWFFGNLGIISWKINVVFSWLDS